MSQLIEFPTLIMKASILFFITLISMTSILTSATKMANFMLTFSTSYDAFSFIILFQFSRNRIPPKTDKLKIQ